MWWELLLQLLCVLVGADVCVPVCGVDGDDYVCGVVVDDDVVGCGCAAVVGFGGVVGRDRVAFVVVVVCVIDGVVLLL